jgi:hypothetical protein
VVPGDPEQEHPAHHERAEDRMRERGQCGVVGEHGPHVGHDGPAVLADLDAHWVLHPRVGDDDEVRRDPGADDRAPQGRQVHALAQSAPAEDPDAEEGGFEEEGEQALECERGAEHIPDEPRVLAPGHPELELLDQARGHTEDEVDEVELAPELGHPEEFLLAGAHPGGLHHGDHRPETDRERDHEEVVDGRDAELPARDLDDVHRTRTPFTGSGVVFTRHRHST